MTSNELRQKYLKFFESKGHKIIPSASLVPENDPTTLFVSAGMQPLIPCLLGKPHQDGKRLVDAQKCVRTNDIDEVGDLVHHTFFEMLGNWSFGDYWKKEAITFTYEFFIKELNFDPEKLSVTCFAGDNDAPKDIESAEIWRSLGIPDNRIYFNGKEDNWWASPGGTGPCGPDSEIFIDLTNKSCGEDCQPGCKCGRFTELGNNVFMEYNKTEEGKFEKLKQRNVDFGGGLERNLAIVNGFDDDYQTDLFLPIIQRIEQITGKKYEENQVGFRIIADHLKASVFLILDGVLPSNKLQGYVLRRLLRRAMVKMHSLSGKVWNAESLIEIIELILKIYQEVYVFDIEKDLKKVSDVMVGEMQKFALTLERGLKELDKIISQQGELNGLNAFTIYESYGFPLELLKEILKQKNVEFSDESSFENAKKAHQELSQKVSAGMFKGGLGEQSEITTKYHTATHLLHAALRKILGDQVQQKGSNITTERLRFDFSYPEKISQENLQKIEDLVNQKIQENLSVISKTMGKEEALKSGALGFFTEKYGDKVTVYTIGQIDSHPEQTKSHPELVLRYTQDPELAEGVSGSLFSKEICGGPHVKNTKELGTFKIIKEESAGANLRRIYAVLS